MSESLQNGGFFPLVYDELRRLAAVKLAVERPGHTLDATALVHEAYLRLGAEAFADLSDFMRAAAVAMQRILVDHARRSAPPSEEPAPRSSPSMSRIAWSSPTRTRCSTSTLL